MNPNFNNMPFMPMQNIPNQNFNLNLIHINQILEDYKKDIASLQNQLKEKQEEIAKLRDQLMLVSNYNLNYQQFINNNINPINNPFQQIHNINNQNLQMNMLNNMHMINNPMFQNLGQGNFNKNMMMPVNLMENINQKEIKPLNIKFKMENGQHIFIQSNSNEQLKTAISKFESKMNDFDNYDYYINGTIKPKFTSTIEENGLCGENDFILAKDKRKLDIGNSVLPNMDPNFNILNNNKKNDIYLDDFNQELPQKINVIFKLSNGLMWTILLNFNNTLKYALMKFCSITGVDPSSIGKDIHFIHNAQQLKADDERTLRELSVSTLFINVLDQNGMIGA